MGIKRELHQHHTNPVTTLSCSTGILMGGNLPSLSIYYITMNKRCYIGTENVMIRGFFGIGVAMATLWRRHVFYVPLFSVQGNTREVVPPMVLENPDFGKVWRNSMRKFWKYSVLKRICKGHKNIEYTCYEGRAVRVFRLPQRRRARRNGCFRRLSRASKWEKQHS